MLELAARYVHDPTVSDPLQQATELTIRDYPTGIRLVLAIMDALERDLTEREAKEETK